MWVQKRLPRARACLLAASAAIALAGGAASGTGAPAILPLWSPGTLEIHRIGTGRGNSAFFRRTRSSW